MQAIVDGLVGLSECSYKPENSSTFVSELSKLIQGRIDEMTFRQKLESLHGLTMGTNYLSQEAGDTVRSTIKALVESIDEIVFDITSNELSFEEHKMVFDVYSNLKFAKDKDMRDLNFKSEALLSAMNMNINN